MVRADQLSELLSEFARTLTTDFPIQAILDHLVDRIVDVLPVTAAGVTLISAGRAPRYVAASDSSALRFERVQSDLGQGPCALAFEGGEPVLVPDLHTDIRFPEFTPQALAAGMVAVFAFPLRHGDGRLGALDLYRDSPGGLLPADLAAAQTLADVAAAHLSNAQAREDARVTAERFRYTALHDPLTGLPNRAMLAQRLEHAAARAARSSAPTAVLFADLDRFKLINDTYGHHLGDELLLAVARRLAALVRPGDTLARFSGDEFVFLCEDLCDIEDAENVARRIDSAFVRPFQVAGIELEVTASVGLAVSGPGRPISHQLVVDADTAMYQVKRNGGAGHRIIDLQEAVCSSDRNLLERDLRKAIRREELDIAYQPIVATLDGKLTGVEALLRWTHPDRGAVTPISMVTIAEQSGLISEIGEWVLKRSCADRARWLREQPDAPVDLCVNVSPRQLMNPGFVTTVTDALAETGMDARALVVELTENILIKDSASAMTVLDELKSLGVRLALDDFGTGYSSLNYLRWLPIDLIKIDQSFTTDLVQTSAGWAIVAAMTDLAHTLHLTVVAEGVEFRQQHDAVRTIGCDAAQGYFYGRPEPRSGISARLGAVAAR